MYDPATGGFHRVDPTGEMFLKSEEKAGGPTDPIHTFDESVNTLFPSKYTDYTQHPMYPCLAQFSFKVTPGMPLSDID